MKTKTKIWMLRTVLLFALLVLFTGGLKALVRAAVSSDGDPRGTIDSYVKNQMKRLHIPGAALAIVQGNQVVYLQAYGVADPSGRTMTPQTPFMLASVSKSFTALAVMRLVQEGKLNLDEPVQKVLPWFHMADGETKFPEASAQITVRQLLNQTSGLTEMDGNLFNLDTSLADDALITSMKRLSTVKLGNPPGQSFEYSNLNYGLLGAIVETVSGQSFETYIQQNIFDPLAMTHSYTSLSAARIGGLTSGYYPFSGVPVAYDHFMPYARSVTPWAGLFSSAEDLAHYLIAQLNDGKYSGKSVLSPENISELHQPGAQVDQWYGYGMGWWIGPFFDLATRDPSSYTIPILYSHEGSWANYRTIAILEPQKKVGLVLLMNTNNPAIDSAYGMVGWDVLSIYSGNQPAYNPPAEDFIRQNSRLVFAGIILLLAASLIWFIGKLRRWAHQPSTAPRRWKWLEYLLIPLAVDAFIAWYLLTVELPQAKSTLFFVLRMAPDIGLLTLLVLLLAIVWGTIRTVWMLRVIFLRSRKEKTALDQPEGWQLGKA